MSKLSKVQREVLTHMAEGHKIYSSTRDTFPPWLNGVTGDDGRYKRVHRNTVYALIDRGYIEKANTEATPWWRRDYIITQEGRGAIREVIE